MSEHTLTTETGPLGYHLLGAGSPQVAVLPGWGLNGLFIRTTAVWPVLEEWAAAHPLLVLDRRGAGLSRQNRGEITPEQLAADLLAALDHAGAERVTVWAHGDAGLAAVPLAAQQPGRVERLVLQGAFARLLAAPDSPHGMALDAMMKLAMLDPAAPVMSELEALGTAPGAEGDGLTRLRETLAPGLLPRLLNDVAAVDARTLLPSVRVPVLVLHGADDPVITAAAATALARFLPAAQIEVIPGMGHLAAPDQLRSLLARIEAFLAFATEAPTTEA